MPNEQGRARLLVVEDDLATRSGMCELLERAGYICTAAASFETALTLLRTSPPDLLITDVRLGAFNGLQLVIRQAGLIPIIVMTAFDDAVIKAAVETTHASYVVKPICPADLLRKVEALLGRLGAPSTE